MQGIKFLLAIATGVVIVIVAMIPWLIKPKITPYTNLSVKNSSKQDSVLVYVTLQTPNSVIGLFGIQDTIGSCSKGTFYAYKDSVYTSDLSGPLEGVVISFGGDNLPCQVAVTQGYPFGINIFECSINTHFEVFDISCEDGVNSILRTTVSDTINWSTGDGDFQQTYITSQNTFPIEKNLNIPGVYPWRCTDCIALGTAIPQNCFGLKDTCNINRICQVARTNNNGGNILIEYVSPAFQICK